jgi:hypothetical protein
MVCSNNITVGRVSRAATQVRHSSITLTRYCRKNRHSRTAASTENCHCSIEQAGGEKQVVAANRALAQKWRHTGLYWPSASCTPHSQACTVLHSHSQACTALYSRSCPLSTKYSPGRDNANCSNVELTQPKKTRSAPHLTQTHCHAAVLPSGVETRTHGSGVQVAATLAMHMHTPTHSAARHQPPHRDAQ